MSARLLPALFAVLFLVACAGTPDSPESTSTPLPTAVASGADGASPTPTTPTPVLTSPDRPTPDIPDVRPPGVVAAPAGMGPRRWTGQSLEWRSCPAGTRPEAECAEVLAPLDWGDVDGEAVTLFLTRIPATRTPALGTLFVNPGGPGEPGAPLAGAFRRQGLEQYDIVGWDPRGTGRSTPVVCARGDAMEDYLSMDMTPDDDAERAVLIESHRAFGQSCLDGSGRLLQHISTLDTVRDLDLLRGLVGDEKLNYFGYSYGTDIGSRYAHEFPDRVGHIALDGAVNVSGSEVLQVAGFERALGEFATWCAERQCGLGRTPTAVTGSITELFDALDAEPIPVGTRELNQTLAVTGVFMMLYSPSENWGTLSAAVEQARGGDGALLLRLADFYNARADDGSYDTRQPAFVAIRCLDRADDGLAGADRRAEEEIRQAPILGPYSGPSYDCPLWPVPPIPKPEPVIAAGAAPILVIGTTGDSATPYEFAVGMADQLESGILLTYEGSGHSAYGGASACVNDAVVGHFTGTPPADRTTCR